MDIGPQPRPLAMVGKAARHVGVDRFPIQANPAPKNIKYRQIVAWPLRTYITQLSDHTDTFDFFFGSGPGGAQATIFVYKSMVLGRSRPGPRGQYVF